MQEITSQFLDAMAEAGIIPVAPDILPDDKWHNLQASGDKPSKKVIYYRLKIDGAFAVGNFGTYREGVTHNWHLKANGKLSDEDRDAIKLRIKAEREIKDAERVKAQDKAAREAKKRLADADLPIDTHPYLLRKGVKLPDLLTEGDNLLVPMRDSAGKLWGVQTISPDGDKLFMAGGRITGCFYALDGPDKSTIFIAEGIATCASVKLALPEFTVICAFNAGNLPPVAEAMRKQYPDAMIVIACDNDAFTLNAKGEPYNVGITKGQQAAMKAKGFAILPEFLEGTSGQPTDWNDIHRIYGLEEVRNQILSKLVIPAAAGEAPAEVSKQEAYGLVGVQASAEGDNVGMQGDMGLPFRVLGYNDGIYYYFPFNQKQIIALSAASHSINNLLQLASFDQWQRSLGGGAQSLSATQLATFATNALFRLAESRGVFAEEDRVRGCGAWMDAGRRVLHCGDTLIVDGATVLLENIKGRFVYIAAQKMLQPATEPLSSAQAHKLRQICEMPTWETKLSGSLLAGWLVIAPVCSILPWRPHIWVTGESGSGKSSVLDKIIKPILNPIALCVDGGTTEPGIRDRMGNDGRPIIYDEAESETQNQRSTMEGVLSLARKASSGAVVAKFGQKPFKAQFCMCLSAINPGITAFADESRISMLSLKKNKKQTAQEDYDNLLNIIAETLTPEFQAGLLARTVANMPTLLKNIEVFRTATRTVLKAARIADQIAPMLAGLYLLGSDKVIERSVAEEWVEKQNWTFNTIVENESDSERLMRNISTSIIRAGLRKEAQQDYTIGELINALVNPNDIINIDFARRTLSMYSISVKDKLVDIGYKSPNLSRVLKNTQWELNWHRTLSDVSGAEQKSSVYFSHGDKQRAIRIPAHYFIGEDDNTPPIKKNEDLLDDLII